MNNNNLRNGKSNFHLINGNIHKSVLSIALPLVVVNTFSIALELIDAFFVGRLGPQALAAIAMASVVIFFLATFGVGLGIGTVALVSAAFGEGDFEKADKIALQSLYLGIVVSLILGVFGFFFSPWLLNFLGAKGDVLIMGSKYLKILFAGILAMFFMFLGNAVFQGAGDTKVPMKIGAITVIINIILDPLLIFGLIGFPRLGVSGAALATVISRTIGGIIMLSIFFRGKHLVQIKLDDLGLNFKIIKKILLIGFPGSIQMLLRSFSAVVLIKIVALFGTTVIAAYGIGGRIFHFFLLPGFCFGGAAATLVGQNLGAKNPHRAYKSALLSSYYYLGFLLVSGTIVFIFSSPIAALFNPEKEFVKICSLFLKYLAVGSVFLSSGVIFSRALQGAGDTISPMLITGLSLYIFQIPLAYLLSMHLGFNERGIWIAGLMGSFINGLIMAIIFLNGKWKYRKVGVKIN
ncbi:MATE family efflux transporter [bacterium]|nr:MATE family efflux transporter [bacterium]